jgi:protein O-GlcNAc transferase
LRAGSILKEQGKIDQALAHYQEAINIDPQFADAYSNMGNAYKDLQRLDDAIRCNTMAIRLRPNFADAYCNLAAAYKDGGRIDDAITCYRKALSLKPEFPDAFANYVHSLLTVSDWRLLFLPSSFISSHFVLGHLYRLNILYWKILTG